MGGVAEAMAAGGGGVRGCRMGSQSCVPPPAELASLYLFTLWPSPNAGQHSPEPHNSQWGGTP